MKTKYTTARLSKMREALVKGLSITGVCGLVGISRETFYRWMREERDFYDMVTQAQAQFEQTCIDTIIMNPRTALQLLERQRREEYKPPSKTVEVDGIVGIKLVEAEDAPDAI
jgi:transposase-like protein